MREINGTLYSFGLLDTGIISEVIKNRQGERNALVKLMIDVDMIPCISIWSIMELRERKDLYSTFLELFAVIPFCLIRSHYHLMEDELASFPDPSGIEPIAISFSMFAEDPGAKLPTFIPRLFSHPEVKKAEKLWGSGWKQDTLNSILSLKSNFSPRRERYNADDAKRFIEEGVFQYIATQAPQWTKDLLESGREFDPHSFPSVKMMFYTVFYRFYAENRIPEIQDVFDILIANAAPYLDMLITERFQAEIFRKVKHRDSFLEHVSIRTIGSLNQ